MPGTLTRRLTDRKSLSPNTGQRSFFRKQKNKLSPIRAAFLTSVVVLNYQVLEEAFRCRMGLKCLIKYRGSSRAQIFKELKDLGCKRNWGRYSQQTAEETQGNTPVDSYHHKMTLLKSSEQLCNGRGVSSNKTY